MMSSCLMPGQNNLSELVWNNPNTNQAQLIKFLKMKNSVHRQKYQSSVKGTVLALGGVFGVPYICACALCVPDKDFGFLSTHSLSSVRAL